MGVHPSQASIVVPRTLLHIPNLPKTSPNDAVRRVVGFVWVGEKLAEGDGIKGRTARETIVTVTLDGSPICPRGSGGVGAGGYHAARLEGKCESAACYNRHRSVTATL